MVGRGMARKGSASRFFGCWFCQLASTQLGTICLSNAPFYQPGLRREGCDPVTIPRNGVDREFFAYGSSEEDPVEPFRTRHQSLPVGIDWMEFLSPPLSWMTKTGC